MLHQDQTPRQFSTWAPKAFANIGKMHPTLEDRSIPIELKRKLKTEQVERIPHSDKRFAPLRRKIARWAQDNLEALRKAQPSVPKELHDRAQDNWTPLLAIAERIGGDRAEEARLAAVRLSGVDDDETPAILLLEDIARLFDQAAKGHGKPVALSSQDIVDALMEMEGRPWPEYARGNPRKRPSRIFAMEICLSQQESVGRPVQARPPSRHRPLASAMLTVAFQ